MEGKCDLRACLMTDKLVGSAERSPLFGVCCFKGQESISAGRNRTRPIGAPSCLRSPTTSRQATHSLRSPTTGRQAIHSLRSPTTGRQAIHSLRSPKTGRQATHSLRSPTTGRQATHSLRSPTTGRQAIYSLRSPTTSRQATHSLRSPTTGVSYEQSMLRDISPPLEALAGSSVIARGNLLQHLTYGRGRGDAGEHGTPPG
ncbi:thymidylate kinase [Plakobranchus ocellatus]|uniref:Thymidylate kinase n=1 Tax=Plakobranchus ocellatus TaxID=259542 RepID=A0AAV3ZCQ1_9GAST|nr:thymidylate kinase [Plakobranchus ocellatus]